MLGAFLYTCMASKKVIPNLRSQRFTLVVSLKNFIVSLLHLVSSIIHLELILCVVQGKKQHFLLLLVDIPAPYVEKNYFLHWIVRAPCQNQQCIYSYAITTLSLYFCSKFFSWEVSLSTLLSLKIVLPILSPFNFQMNFSIILLMPIKKGPGILTGISKWLGSSVIWSISSFPIHEHIFRDF